MTSSSRGWLAAALLLAGSAAAVACSSGWPTSAPSSGAASARPASESAAEAIVSRRTGYGHCDTNGWVDGDTFQVLICIAPGAATPPELAFFFAAGAYLGTDTKDASAQVRVASRSTDTVTLAYNLFRFGDPDCCPTGGSVLVRYRWDGAAVTALDPTPPEMATASTPGRVP